MKSPEHEKRLIERYIENEASDETITHLEKIASQRVFGRKYDIWDVHTDVARWWVITQPINLYSYSQANFPSMDFALTFHIGLTARVMARSEPDISEEERDLSPGAWRRWSQAADALSEADEAEEFQAVGMRCRECLLTFSREIARNEMVPRGETAPKRGDFVHWSEYIANTIASGPSSEQVRGYLKSTAQSTWELVNWLTHARSAARLDGQLAVDAASHLLTVFSVAYMRFTRGTPNHCPKCGSRELTTDYRPEHNADSPYVTFCPLCGWEDSEAQVPLEPAESD